MTHTVIPKQRWALIGNTTACETIWNVRRTNIPCAYALPTISIADSEQHLMRPSFVNKSYIMGGIALEVKKTGRDIKLENAEDFIAGYRMWIGIYNGYLIERLTDAQNSIQIWDHGIAIPFGLWFENSHIMGDLLSPEEMQRLIDETMVLEASSGTKSDTTMPSDYRFWGREIIAFMSEFMTVSSGDQYFLGPLVYIEDSKDIKSVQLTHDQNVLRTGIVLTDSKLNLE